MLVQLGDVLERQRRPVSTHPDVIYREIGIRSFGRGIFHKVPRQGVEVGEKRLFAIHPGDLTLNIVFAWEGAVAIAGEAEAGTVASHRFPTYRVREDRADLRYLRHILVHGEGRDLLERASPGSAGRNRTLNLDRFEHGCVSLPTLSEQRRVADRVDTLLKQTTTVATKRNRLARLATAVVDAAFAQLVARATPRELGEVMTLALHEVPVDPTTDYRVAGVYSFGRGLLHRSTISGADTKYTSFNRLRAGRFVYSRLGSWEGALAVVPPDFDGFVASQEYPTFDIDLAEADPRYLSFLCRWRGFWELLSPRGSMVRRKRVKPDALLATRVPIPSLPEQQRLGAMGDRLRQIERHLEASEPMLRSLEPAIIGAGLRGEL